MKTVTCPACAGKGKRLLIFKCGICAGKGKLSVADDCVQCGGKGSIRCEKCKGVGRKTSDCQKCGGKGKVKRKDAINTEDFDMSVSPRKWKNTLPDDNFY